MLFSQYLECTGLCVYTIYGCMCIHIHKYIHKNESLVSIRTCMSAHLFIDFLPSLESVLHGDEASFFFADSILYYIPKGIILSALSDLLLCLIKVTRCEANFSCSFYWYFGRVRIFLSSFRFSMGRGSCQKAALKAIL